MDYNYLVDFFLCVLFLFPGLVWLLFEERKTKMPR